MHQTPAESCQHVRVLLVIHATYYNEQGTKYCQAIQTGGIIKENLYFAAEANAILILCTISSLID